MKICIIIPMYNEERIAKQSLETIISYADELPSDTSVLVVNDGSKDDTEKIVKAIIRERGNSIMKLVSHDKNQGYGAALKTGMHYAAEQNYDYALFMDSDLTNHPRYLKSFYKKIEAGCDYIKATRYANGGAIKDVPRMHRIMSAFGNKLARLLYGLPLTDLTNGFRAVKVDLLRKMDLKEPGFTIIMEELYLAKFMTDSFCEIPSELTSRSAGQGKSKFSYGPGTCFRYLKYPLKTFIKSLIGRRPACHQ